MGKINYQDQNEEKQQQYLPSFKKAGAFEQSKELRNSEGLPDIGNRDVAMRLIAEKMSERMEEDILRKCSTVDHPPHYNKWQKEAIDVVKDVLTPEEFKGFLKGNIIKYAMRAPYKGSLHEDLDKAKWYSERLKEEEKCHE